MFMEQKKKKKKKYATTPFSLFCYSQCMLYQEGRGGGKEEEQKIKGKRRNTCRERDPMRVNRYIWSLP